MTDGAFIAIHAAKKRKQRLRREEEEMTSYNSDDLEGNWEFKIVRSGTPVFRKPEVFESLLEEESMAGWELVEKLDNQRVRFKRPRDARRRDDMLPPGMGPYRTQYGSAETTAVIGVAIGVALLLAFGIIAAFLFGADTPSDAPDFVGIATIVPVIIILFIIGILAFVRIRR
ncbi:MAG: hypothetical protein FVQ83_10640 [Chloroflexi bacterium]|nr:hypothetical protein [Chloroflexota bacterium]